MAADNSPSQRLRLVKSSRKIEAMLGATPLVLDRPPRDPSSQPSPKLERSKSRSGKRVQPILLSRSRTFAAAPSSYAAPSQAHIKSSSLDTSASSIPPTPLSAMFSPLPQEESEAKEREMRRKKMAKIMRTFGENVPPELVFGSGSPQQRRDENKKSAPSPTSCTSPRKIRRPGGLNLPSLSTPNVIIESSSPRPEDGELTPRAPPKPPVERIPFPPSQPFYQHEGKAHSHTALRTTSSLLRSRSQRTIAGYPVYHHTATTPSPSQLQSQSPSALDLDLSPTPTPVITPTTATMFRSLRGGYSPLKRAFTPETFTSPVPPSPRNAFSLDVERPGTAFSNFQEFAVSGREGALSPDADYIWVPRQQDSGRDGGRRKEEEWSGEWNVKDMGDVMKKLRELKGR